MLTEEAQAPCLSYAARATGVRAVSDYLSGAEPDHDLGHDGARCQDRLPRAAFLFDARPGCYPELCPACRRDKSLRHV
jgi:hypothetical protein